MFNTKRQMDRQTRPILLFHDKVKIRRLKINLDP